MANRKMSFNRDVGLRICYEGVVVQTHT